MSGIDFLTNIQLDEMSVLRNVINSCREILSSPKQLTIEQRKDALEELNDASRVYQGLVESIKQ